jgi:hypothetical protein
LRAVPPHLLVRRWQGATTKRHIEMIHYVVCAAIAVVVWLLFLRSRRSRPDAPPAVSSKSGIPLLGILMEFFKSPNSMVQRCLKDYGPVFTIPVSTRVGERERYCVAVFCRYLTYLLCCCLLTQSSCFV